MRTQDPPSFAAFGARILMLLAAGGLLIAGTAYWRRARPDPAASASPTPSGSALPASVVDAFVALEAREAEVARTVGATDLLARTHGAVVERLWDALNGTPNGLGLLATTAVESVSWPDFLPPTALPHDITRRTSAPAAPQPRPDWRDQLEAFRAAGWKLDQSEWRHIGFQPPHPGAPATSTFQVSLHLSRLAPPEQAQLQARLLIRWPTPANASHGADETGFALGRVEAESVEWISRSGPTPFPLVASFEIEPFPKTSWIDPVILHDLGGDPTPEILLVARNVVLARARDGSWNQSVLSPHHPGLLFTAALADLTGDSIPDLLMAVRTGLVLLPGSADGSWNQPLRTAWLAPEKLRYAQALTCGDIDLDGDLDVFVGQYRTPYESGQMPRPFFDANDGPPSYLLRNRGDGSFDDVTPGSGLERLRHRRTYGASFVDLDRDGDLDLTVISDFAGIDAHANLGNGRFEVRTGTWLDEPRGFGMAHAYADFDASGAFDLLLIGMPQPTADRLAGYDRERPGFESWATERRRVTFGNRLYFAGESEYRQRPEGQTLARSGWAWGVADADLDHDRYPDLFIVNGHETRASVRDYEPEFWNHDVYVGDSTPRPEVDAYFASKFARTRSSGWSYGGYEKNRLLLNQRGAGFVEAGHLFGLALEADSRNAVADDLDGDGDSDLVVTTFEVWPQRRQTVRIHENRVPNPGHWIGVRLRQPPGTPPIVGAVATLTDTEGTQQRPWVLGNRYRSQDAPVLRFGLGPTARPVRLEVRWPGGKITTLQQPAADQVHEVNSPAPGTSP